ncbi:hypothetical protein THTE_1084 [Thermogutta terrifontis]|uniref:Uncharacterized protein n=1 Tax=Thermogutta terrifontis TaxID=1331910 RepID=A0A286RCJ2_9BACT|nr:hypothetical protein THTE_1084 [Thermogutta terrifontis]
MSRQASAEGHLKTVKGFPDRPAGHLKRNFLQPQLCSALAEGNLIPQMEHRHNSLEGLDNTHI